MAQTFTSYNSGVAFAASKNMGAVLNGHASEVLKIRRVGLLNAQTAAVTGVICQLEMRGYFSGSPGLTSPTAVTPTAHDSTNSAPTTATYGHAGTIAGTATTFRRVFWSSDEAAISTATLDELQTLVPLNIIFDAGYGDSNVQPMTLRQNQMALVFNTTGAAGLLDTWIEFTKE
jgi:hypothetical protein